MFNARLIDGGATMQADNVKDHLITATMKLLAESKNPGKITARQIAAEADANLAMINYYFNSKDALVNIAVNKLMADRANELKEIRDSDIPAKQRLEEFLITMSDITIDYSELSKPTMPFLLLEGEIELPYYILPMIKECYGDRKSETDCRIIAYQLISFSQLTFYRSDEFAKYTGIDINEKKQRDKLLKTILATFLGNNLGD
jgi:AcrR family transcriptional regulator